MSSAVRPYWPPKTKNFKGFVSECQGTPENCAQIDKRKSWLIDMEKKSSVDSVETKSMIIALFQIVET
ncbi:hypothetical protein GCK72_012267 [Caenorhabditis remanei]|uniref:Uncharacterized protein n=1 Tax=Caenorhabditis remanei TaxID=31234 RepID=A0A6A5GKH2_CAERE|nr:hypothetical protein GCK72_012267 [Caenorhabditis remanei]KAF1755817.1 hypothetical protein GCK72_012267 [Caenorhabditis remanei]